MERLANAGGASGSSLIGEALSLSETALARDLDVYASQMTGRLLVHRHDPEVRYTTWLYCAAVSADGAFAAAGAKDASPGI